MVELHCLLPGNADKCIWGKSRHKGSLGLLLGEELIRRSRLMIYWGKRKRGMLGSIKLLSVFHWKTSKRRRLKNLRPELLLLNRHWEKSRKGNRKKLKKEEYNRRLWIRLIRNRMSNRKWLKRRTLVLRIKKDDCSYLYTRLIYSVYFIVEYY